MREQTAEPEYVPGICNIGVEETRRRYRYAYVGLLLSLLLILFLEGFAMDRLWRLLLCLPVALSLTGFVQATQRFCLRYGLLGVFSVKEMRKRTHVTEESDRQQDRKTAMKIVFKIFMGTILLTLLYYFLPSKFA